MAKKYWWRRQFTHEKQRADAECEDVWIRNDKFILVKFPSDLRISCKWGVFTPLNMFIDRHPSGPPPLQWADKIIAKSMNDLSCDEI